MIPLFVEAAARSLLVAAAVWAGLRVFRVSNVLAQKAAWGLVLVTAILMPLLLSMSARLPDLPIGATLVIPSLSRAAPPAAMDPGAQSSPSPGASEARPAAQSSLATEDVPVAANRFPAPTISGSNSDIPAPAPRSSLVNPLRNLSWPDALWMLYFAVSGVLVMRLLFGLAAALHVWQTGEPVSLELGGDIPLRSSRAIASPITIGSAVVLPDDYHTWDSEKLRIVLAHERSHIRQGDFYLQTLAGLYSALFWFSPLGWWVKRKLSDLAEAISDRAGLEEAASRSSYAQVLLEFAALPRPTLIGVAMARNGSLSRRIERLLNDTSFRQAFAGTRRRALIAVLLVPVALFATAFVHVQAADQATPQTASPAQPEEPITGVSTPEPVGPSAAPAAVAPASAIAPAAPAVPAVPSVTPVAPVAPVTPLPPASFGEGIGIGVGQSTSTNNVNENHNSHGSSYRYSYDSNGESYALIRGDKDRISFSGDWIDGRREELAKARQQAHGDFLWFTRGDKSYFVDDPATINQIEAMYKPIEDLGKQQEALGKQQEALGRQQEELGHQQEQTSVPTPDMSKEIAAIEAQLAKLKAAQGKAMKQDQFAEIQGKLGDLQGKLGDIQGQIGARQGEFGAKMGELGRRQGELGAQQGRLGAEQGRISREADQRVKAIIDESLKNGKAHPVQ
jgi:beta-lactamase regulating signal transducer with metallopeptidase domain